MAIEAQNTDIDMEKTIAKPTDTKLDVGELAHEESTKSEAQTIQQRANEWKEKGNVQLRDKDREGAIESYTKAIELLPTEAVYWY